jgi:hypothetical protein
MPQEPVKKPRKFEVNGTKYAVRVPSIDEMKRANERRATTFNESLSRGDLLRDQLESELRKRKLWNDDREQKYQTLRKEVIDGEYTLQKGGIKLSEARTTALGMTSKRNEMVEMLSSRTDLDSNTCEGKADAARFNYLFACCLVYEESGDPYFTDPDEYLRNQDDDIAVAGASEFYYLISGSESVDERLPENKFLHKFKFIDGSLRLIDKDGRLINDDGKHVDTDGNFVEWNKDGTCTKVDPIGRPVNKQGDFDVEHAAFLDDDDVAIDESIYHTEPVSDEKEESSEEEPKPKRAKKKTVKAKAEPSEEAVKSDS